MQGQLERTGKRTNKNTNLARARDEGDAIDSIFGFERFKQVSDFASLLPMPINNLNFFPKGSASRTGWLLNYLAIVRDMRNAVPCSV